MITLLQYLFTRLSEAQIPIYFEQAPNDAQYPYAVFKLPDSLNIESDRQDYSLIVDVWDNKPDTTILETLTDSLDNLLYKQSYLDTNQHLLFQRENRLMIPDEDSSIRRRQLQYTIKRYER